MASTVLFAAFRRLSDSGSFCFETSPKGACACNFAFAAILPAGSVTWAPSSTAYGQATRSDRNPQHCRYTLAQGRFAGAHDCYAQQTQAKQQSSGYKLCGTMRPPRHQWPAHGCACRDTAAELSPETLRTFSDFCLQCESSGLRPTLKKMQRPRAIRDREGISCQAAFEGDYRVVDLF